MSLSQIPKPSSFLNISELENHQKKQENLMEGKINKQKMSVIYNNEDLNSFRNNNTL